MTDITDEELAATLQNRATELPRLREQFLQAVAVWDALALDKIPWVAPVQHANGAWSMGYPDYPGELWQVYEFLGQLAQPLGANELTERQPIVIASLGYAIRLILVTFRAERFVDGAIAGLVDSGELSVALAKITTALQASV